MGSSFLRQLPGSPAGQQRFPKDVAEIAAFAGMAPADTESLA